MQYLKDKIDAGATFIFTQMFYDVQVFIDWVKAVRAAGITVPIVPGIAPIQTWNGFQRATSLAKIIIPQFFLDALEPHKNNDEQVRAIGTRLVADMCRTILKENLGIRGLHFYTMNLEKGTKMLLEELNLVPRVETIKPLPWRQVSTRSIYRIDIDSCISLLHLTGGKRQFVPSSGRTGPNRTSHVQRIGTNIRMDDLATHGVLPTANLTDTVFG
jgi:Methylenetetrahydrofolate reductase